MKNVQNEFIRSILNPFKFKMFLLKSLPLAYVAGLKVRSLNEDSASVSLKYGYFTKNPFRSIYFACMNMAAELSTGVLAMMWVYKSDPAISMLITGNEARFLKKATGTVMFTCSSGKEIFNIVQKAKTSGLGETIRVASIGKDESGEIVAEIFFTWSFKVKVKKN